MIKNIIPNNDLTANSTPFRFGYDSTLGAYGYILNEGGADTVIPFKTGGGGATLIGSYTGNQTIDVSSYLQSGDTADNFIVELISSNTASNSRTNSDRPGTNWVLNVRSSGTTIVKTLNGNNLEITGASINASSWLTSWGSTLTATANVNYNIYYIGTIDGPILKDVNPDKESIEPYLLHLSGTGDTTGGVYSYIYMHIESYSGIFINLGSYLGRGSIAWYNGSTQISSINFNTITKNVWTELEKPFGATDIKITYIAAKSSTSSGTNSVNIYYSLLV